MNEKSAAAPKITVLMPVFNGEEFVGEAIESILGQTFGDFEFLIINDGSTDRSLSIIKEYAAHDARIRIVSRENKGLIATLNEGIDLARGAYIARMDCDDLSFPQRFEEQYRYMRAHPDCVVCGCTAYKKSLDGRGFWYPSLRVTPQIIWTLCVFGTPYVHASAFLDTAAIRAGGYYYDPRFEAAEDMELWGRIILDGHPVAVIDKHLVMYRAQASSISIRNSRTQMLSTMKIIERNLRRLGVEVPNGVFQRVFEVGRDISKQDCEEIRRCLVRVFNWIDQFPGDERQALHKHADYILNRLVRETSDIHNYSDAYRLVEKSQHKDLLTARLRWLVTLGHFLPKPVMRWLMMLRLFLLKSARWLHGKFFAGFSKDE